MTILRRRTPHGSPPGVPVIRGDLLAYRPMLVLLPGHLTDRSLSAGRSAALQNGLIVKGGALDFDGTDDYVDLGNGGLAADSAHTVLVCATLRSFNVQYPVLFNYLTSGGSGRRKLFFSKFNETGYADITFGLHGDSGTGTAGWSLTPGQASGGPGVLNVEHSMVVRCVGTATTNYEMWRAGQKLSRAGLSQATNTQTGLNCVGRSSTDEATNHLNGLVKLLVVFDAILPDALCQALSADPWSMFTTQRRRAVAAAGGGASVTATGIASAEAFGTAVVARRAAVTATGIASAEAFGTAVVARRAAVTATGIASAEAFGTHTLARRTSSTVTATGIASAEAFGAHVLLRASVRGITGTGIASAEAIGAHVLLRASVRGVTATGIASAEAIGTASITRRQGVTCTGIASAGAFGAHVLTRNGVTPSATRGSRIHLRIGMSL